jgi:cysteine-rich repeat protein
MSRRWIPLFVLGTLSACSHATPESSGAPAEPAHAVGALLVATEVADATIDRVEYTLTSKTRQFEPQVGTLAVADGLAQAQLEVPAGSALEVELRMLSKGVALCEGHARELSVEAGRTAQVRILPLCGDERFETRAGNNRPPRIEAVFASRRNVRFGEEVAIAVSAYDKEGDNLRYEWSESVAGAGFVDATAAATVWTAGPRAITRNVLSVVARDRRGVSRPATLEMNFEALALTAGTCEAPTPIAVGQTVRGFTVGAPSEHVSTSCGFDQANPAPEHVFRVVLTERQDLSMTVAGSAFFARLHVRKDDCATPAAEIACDNFTQRIDLPGAEPGTYYVFVDGDIVFSQGEYQLSVFTGTPPESCRNFADDDNDTLVDCADPDCDDEPGCLECEFDCDPNPNDCIAGQCDRFSGRCNAFVNFGAACDTDGDPSTTEACADFGRCVATVCGNGIVDPGEQCDDGNTSADDSCDERCQIVPVCGNGILEGSEECDDGNTAGGDGCEADCRVLAVCGNGLFEGAEQCDDGNTSSGDGCDASCQLELCGGISCNDGNPCTSDGCENAATGPCANTALPDGTACENDGLADTVEQCQAGACRSLPPDRALIILDPSVLALPAFSLRAMHDRLAPDGDGSLLFEQWASTLTTATTIHGRTAAARPGFTRFVQSLARDTSGRIELDQVEFLPSAFVNRFDLRTPGNCGENRLVFTKTSGVTDGNDRATLIFEFNIPDDGSNCVNALNRWVALRELSAEALPSAVATLLETIAIPGELNTLRTNEFVTAPFWELREFHLVDGQLVPAPVVDSVPFELAQDATFRAFVVQNAVGLNRGAREIGIIPAEFLAAASRADGQTLGLGNIVPSIPGLEANVDILSCSGCHLTRTGTGFVHVAERAADRPSELSIFMRSELAFRQRLIESFLAQ